MVDEIKPTGTWRDSWWWKTITLQNTFIKRLDSLIGFFKGLVNKKDPHSSHETISLTWGLGSFGAYWLDHFINHRVFTAQDYTFIAAMSGISLIASVSSKRTDAKGTTEVSDELTDKSGS